MSTRSLLPIARPEPGEYPSFTEGYIGQVPHEGHVLQHLQDNLNRIQELVAPLSDARMSQPHAPGEWTVKDILVHMMDTERIFAYRALRIARGDKTPLPGFEQDDYVPLAGANTRTIADIFEEYTAVRQATLTLFYSLDADALLRFGTFSGSPARVRAVAYIITGHELHHMASIKENYL